MFVAGRRRCSRSRPSWRRSTGCREVGAFDKPRPNLGNLIGPLSELPALRHLAVGRLPRPPARHRRLTYVLIALVIAAGVVGIWWAWERGRLGAPRLRRDRRGRLRRALFLAVSSPWVRGQDARDGVAASVLAAALARLCGGSSARQTRVEAAVAALAIAAGVLWSNTLAVPRRPRWHRAGQLHELETIGHDFAGQGPALMTTYEPYGGAPLPAAPRTRKEPPSCGAASTT